MDRIFKIHCSQIGKIMGRIGLTDKQQARMHELLERKNHGPKPLTENMESELLSLQNQHFNPTLPATAITYLMEWYADEQPDLFNKYFNKGNYVEADLIDFMAEQIGIGMAEKNDQTKENDYLIGTADVIATGMVIDMVIDVKAPWSKKTLHDKIEAPDDEYIWQLRGYMALYDRNEAMVFYGLMDTPEEVNYGREVVYSDLAPEQRFVAYKISRDQVIENEIYERVAMCRDWLDSYDRLVQSRIGRVHQL